MRVLGVAGRRLPVREVRRRRGGRHAAGGAARPVARPSAPSAPIGDLLFRDFLYPFEAISLLLLVAIVGGVVVSRSHQKEVAAERAADYRKQIHELASHDYPGAPRDEAPAAAGGHH